MKNIKDMRKFILILSLGLFAFNAKAQKANFAKSSINEADLLAWLSGDTTLQSNWNILPEQFVVEFAKVMSDSFPNKKFESTKDVLKFLGKRTKIVKYDASSDVFSLTQCNPWGDGVHYIYDRINPGDIIFFKGKSGEYFPIISLVTGNIIWYRVNLDTEEYIPEPVKF